MIFFYKIKKNMEDITLTENNIVDYIADNLVKDAINIFNRAKNENVIGTEFSYEELVSGIIDMTEETLNSFEKLDEERKHLVRIKVRTAFITKNPFQL
jgi:hypothetical protein